MCISIYSYTVAGLVNGRCEGGTQIIKWVNEFVACIGSTFIYIYVCKTHTAGIDCTFYASGMCLFLCRIDYPLPTELLHGTTGTHLDHWPKPTSKVPNKRTQNYRTG